MTRANFKNGLARRCRRRLPACLTDYAQLDETVTSRRASEIDPATVETFVLFADALQLQHSRVTVELKVHPWPCAGGGI